MKEPTPNIPELFEDDRGYCLLGAKTLLNRIEELENQIGGAKKNDDIEYVHKLRVASRRVRTALSIFEECLPTKLTKKWKKTIKNLTSSSGAARDVDVQVAFLENYSTHEDSRAAPGLEYLIKLQKARRAGMQSDLIKVLESLEASEILDEISDSWRTIRRSEDSENSTSRHYPHPRKPTIT